MKLRRRARWSSYFLAPAMLAAALPAALAESPDYAAAGARFAQLVAIELQRQVLPGVSIAWIVDGQTVHTAGYGLADEATGRRATPETIYRAGSISKLFNAIATMQLVEQGKFDLDAPIETALPDFRIVDPFDKPSVITIRQLLCHRSGMIRESPVGSGYRGQHRPVRAGESAEYQNALLERRADDCRASRRGAIGPAVRRVSADAGAQPVGNGAFDVGDERQPASATGQGPHARGQGRRHVPV
jgi:CubicO group peptidase (beta-lactamase class C family)